MTLAGLALGSGEAVNESVLGDRWPAKMKASRGFIMTIRAVEFSAARL